MIAALAYGTQSVEPVDIIAGPGNIFVTLAKKEVYGKVGIDMLAGPSEILILADKTADPSYIAADLLSQAEHDVMARAMLITDDKKLAQSVKEQVEEQLKKLRRAAIAEKSILNNGFIVISPIGRGVDLINKLAPEHVELMVENPLSVLSRINNAGCVFIGKYSPEPVGDYFAGTNHVLPTGGTARFAQGLSTDTFMRKMNVVYYSKESLHKYGRDIINLAESEGLTAHAASVQRRLDEKG